MNNFYEVLGVSLDATQDMIDEAYNLLSAKYPDIKQNEKLYDLQRLDAAHAVLSNPEKRQQYDRLLALQHKINTKTDERPNAKAAENNKDNNKINKNNSWEYVKLYIFGVFGWLFLRKALSKINNAKINSASKFVLKFISIILAFTFALFVAATGKSIAKLIAKKQHQQPVAAGSNVTHPPWEEYEKKKPYNNSNDNAIVPYKTINLYIWSNDINHAYKYSSQEITALANKKYPAIFIGDTEHHEKINAAISSWMKLIKSKDASTPYEYQLYYAIGEVVRFHNSKGQICKAGNYIDDYLNHKIDFLPQRGSTIYIDCY